MNAPTDRGIEARRRFDAAEHSPAQHFRLALFGVIGRIAAACRDGDLRAAFEAHPFLAEYFEQVAPHFSLEEWIGEAWDAALARWEAGAATHLPMLALQSAGLRRLQLELLLAVGLVEDDARFGELFEAARGRDRRPTFGLLLAWWRVAPDGSDRIDLVPGALLELVQAGLLQVLNPDAPRHEWTLTVPAPLWDALGGSLPRLAWLQYTPLSSLPQLADYVAGPSLTAESLALPEALRTHPDALVLVRGPRNNGRKTLLGAVARELGRPMLLA